MSLLHSLTFQTHHGTPTSTGAEQPTFIRNTCLENTEGSPHFSLEKVWMCMRLIFHIQCLTCSRWPSALCGEEALACWIMQTDPFISSLGSTTSYCEKTCFIRYSFRFVAAFFSCLFCRCLHPKKLKISAFNFTPTWTRKKLEVRFF